MSEPDLSLERMLELEDLICDVRNAAWIAQHLDNEIRALVSRDTPGRHISDIDATASEAVSWSIREAEKYTRILFDAFYQRAPR